MINSNAYMHGYGHACLYITRTRQAHETDTIILNLYIPLLVKKRATRVPIKCVLASVDSTF